MTKFCFTGPAGMPHSIEFPYAINVKTAKEWMQTLRYPNPEELKRWQAKHKAEMEVASQKAKEEAARRRAEVFEKAIKLTADEYSGMVYDEDADEYFEEIEDLIEHYYCDGEDRPEFVWATKPAPFVRRDAADLLAEEFEEQYEGCWDAVASGRPQAVTELNAALAKFYDAIDDLHGWTPDYSRAVIIPRPETED